MHLASCCALALALAGSAISITHAEPAPQRTDGQAFSDPTYAYSLRLPRDWEPVANLAQGKVIRLSVVTPARNRFIATIDSLDRRVTRASRFETIAETYVDPIVMRFLRVFKLMDGPRKVDDHSKPDSMRFWQGTSAFGEETGPAMLLSLHAVRFGSNVMVNLVYMSTHSSKEEVQAVDRIMDSLTFD